MERAARRILTTPFPHESDLAEAYELAHTLLVTMVQQLVDGLRESLRTEEERLLGPDLLSDLPTMSPVETG